MKQIKTVSFGGLGDSFIVGCKLNQLMNYYKNENLNHLFVESNQKTLDLIKEYMDVQTFWPFKYKFSGECDENYQINFNKGKWSDRAPINTKWDGIYHFPGDDGIKLEEKYVDLKNQDSKDKIFDVCFQVAGGVSGIRQWKFNIFKLKEMLENKGYCAALIGTNPKFYRENDPRNFVSKLDLPGSMEIVKRSRIYCGLSGFHTYWSLACGTKNIHDEESDEHNSHYIHPSWEKFRYGIKYGSLYEVVSGLRYWGIEV